MTALAHKIAIEAVTNLKSGEILIKSYGPGRFSEVNDGFYSFRFYANHLSFSHRPDRKSWENTFSFDVEEKLYLTSNHRTKISFFSPDVHKDNERGEYGELLVDVKKTKAEQEKRLRKIEDFIKKLMDDAGIEPVPRFNLGMVRA
jgi:hypothetical protein